jgi:hypothetical protein
VKVICFPICEVGDERIMIYLSIYVITLLAVLGEIFSSRFW